MWKSVSSINMYLFVSFLGMIFTVDLTYNNIKYNFCIFYSIWGLYFFHMYAIQNLLWYMMWNLTLFFYIFICLYIDDFILSGWFKMLPLSHIRLLNIFIFLLSFITMPVLSLTSPCFWSSCYLSTAWYIQTLKAEMQWNL